MVKRRIPVYLFVLFVLFLFMIPGQLAHAETLEEQMNNLVGPQKQYSTMLSPVYLRTNDTEESINPQDGGLTLTQTDYVLPGRNGLDLEIKRIYKSGISNVQEMNVRYVGGAWVDYVESDAKQSSFYEDRYNLGIGMRFSFPAIEVRKNEDGTSHKFLHTDSGDVYRLKETDADGKKVLLPEGQTIKDAVISETDAFSNGQSDGVSAYVMTVKSGKKTYFSSDGRVLGIVDRYGNSIVFKYTAYARNIDGTLINKKLMTSITDTVGRVTTIEYKEDDQFTVGPITNPSYSAEERYKASQNPNNTDSGDLQGKFQVVIHLPNGKSIVYDKTAALVSPTKHVIRTRLQRVFGADGLPKYHYWYEQPELGFTYVNGTRYSAYNRYENLAQIDYVQSNRLTRYVYNSYTERLAQQGSMQYRKMFERRELVKTGYDPSAPKFEDRFVTTVKDKSTYSYTNEPDGYGVDGYKEREDSYLRDTYRYDTEVADYLGNVTKYTYDGLHQLIVTEKQGREHKEVIRSERDELKLVKKQETRMYQTADGQAAETPVVRIENFRYDEYGNLTNYTGPEAARDDQGYPTDTEHTVVYTYAYDKFHALTSKTWKQDKNTTSQTLYTVDSLGNVTKETQIDAADPSRSVVTDYAYDSYGNMTKKTASSGGKSFVTAYEYGADANGTDVKGAYLTKTFSTAQDGKVTATRYGYDMATGNRTAEIDANGNKTAHEYDALNRLVKTVQPDGTVQSYRYDEQPFANTAIQYTDPNETAFRYELDTAGQVVKESVADNGQWVTLQAAAYDYRGNKTKETDANGHSIRYEYDSGGRLVKKSFYEKDAVFKGTVTVGYELSTDSRTPLRVTVTDEEGYPKVSYYDWLNRLVKGEVTPDNVHTYTTAYTYDYTGNLTGATDARGHTTAYDYDSLGRLVAEQDALGNEKRYSYNALGKPDEQKEPGGKTTAYVYDALGRVTEKKVYAEGSADYTYTRYTYDLAGNVVRMRQGAVAAGADSLAYDVGYAYDALNRATDEYRTIDGTRTGHIRYAYDHNGNKTGMTDYADKDETKYRQYTYGYDFAGRAVEEQGSYRELQADGTTADYGSYETHYERDYAGNVVQQQAARLGGGYDTTSFEYDNRNQVTAKIEPYGGNAAGKRTSYTYDKKGQLLSESLTVQGVVSTTSQTLDGLGRVTAKIDALGNVTRDLYDENGNAIKEIDPRYQAQPAEEAPGMEYTYDALNRLVLTSAFDGASREVIGYKQYDGRGNVVLEAGGEGYNAAQPEKSYGVRYTYDANDRVITVVSAQTMADNEQNGTGNVTARYTYDGSGHVLTETDALGRVTRYAYTLNGLPKEKTFPDGGKESYDYDLTGKALLIKRDRGGRETRTYMSVFDKPYRIEYPDGTAEQMTYSPKGELIGHTDQAGNVQTFAYNAAGNPIRKKEWIRGDATSAAYKLTELTVDEANRPLSSETFMYVRLPTGSMVKTSAGDRTERTYDAAGNLTRVSGPNGRQTVYVYDAAGHVIETRAKVSAGYEDVTRYAYDLRSRKIAETVLVKVADLSEDELAEAQLDDTYADRALSTTTFAYNKDGKLTEQTDAKGHTAKFVYDYDNRLIRKTDPLGAAATYRYDRKGNLTEETDARGAAVRYDYDALDRLIRKQAPAADGSVAVTRYVYDAMGNLIKQIAPNEYDPALDQASSVLTMKGTGYTYDAMNRRTSTLSPDGAGVEYMKHDALGRVVKVVDGLRYTGDLDASAGTVYSYDGLSRVTKKTDALGYSTAYDYDALGHLTKQTDPRGHATRYVYNGDGTLRQVTYADGGAAAYMYDLLGRKTSETNPLGAVTTYTYNAFGKERTVKDAYGHATEARYDLAGNLVSMKDKRGSVTQYAYDAKGQLIEKRSPLALDGSGNVIYAVESYVYDANGNLLKKRLSGSKDAAFVRETTYSYYANNLLKTEADNSGAFEQRSYDKNGNLTETAKLRETNGTNETNTETNASDIERYAYDNQDRMVKRIRLIGAESLDADSLATADALRDGEDPGQIHIVTSYAYDLLGNRTQEIDPRGFITTYTYDALNRTAKMFRQVNGSVVFVKYTYDENGNKASERNERGMTTVYAYDAMNRLASVTDAEGHTLTYGYDLAGNKTAMTNALGYAMTYAYDKLNRLVTVTDPYGVVITRNVYDAGGNLVKKIDAKGYLSGADDASRYGTVYTYDLAGRLTAETDPEMAASGQSVTYGYNPAGEKVSETNALGETYAYAYDNAGRLVQVTDPLGVTTAYRYDLAGNKLEMMDGRGKTTRYRYGAFGLLLETVNPADKPVAYRYDLTLNLSEMTDRLGRHTRYAYDSRNLLTEKKVVETGDRIAYTYDAKGNRASMSDESGVTRYIYDNNDRLTEVSKGGVTQLTYTYDELGNVKSVTDKSGFATAYTYDKASRMATVTAAGKMTTYAYDKNGNRTSIAYDGGVKETYTYDKNNHALTLKNVSPSGSVLSQFAYTYDGAGRQTSKTDRYGKTNYAYDAAGRIVKLEAPGKTTAYAYDKSGNRLSQLETYTSAQPSGYNDPGSQTEVTYLVKQSEYMYSAESELLQLVERMKDGEGQEVLEKTVSYLYDANGNEVRQQTGYLHPHTRDMRAGNGASPITDEAAGAISSLLERVSNTFDGFNRLKQAERIKGGERSVVAYTYDGDDLRTRKTVRSSAAGYAEKVTNYLYDRQYVVLETDGAEQVAVRYVRGINYIARIDAAGKLSNYLFNGHGDVVQTVSESGVVENQYDYDIFGNPTLTIETYAASIRYAGEFYDAEVGLYYLRARYYDPYIGRFISKDSYRGDPRDPLSLNLYTYAHNNPLLFIDPTGHKVIKQGDRSDGVKAIQEYLTDLGYDLGKADGIFGKKTNEAVLQFQKDYGLKVDGVVGNQTLTTLKTASSVKDAPDYVQQAAMQSAKKESTGGIKDDTILMSNETFDGKLKEISTLQKSTGGVVNTKVVNNKVVVTGVTMPAPKPAASKPASSAQQSKPAQQSRSASSAQPASSPAPTPTGDKPNGGILWGEVAIGTLQTVGGGLEAIGGLAFGVATSETVAGGIFGAAVATNGASHVSGGISRVINGFNGSDAGDTANFEKNAFRAVGGETGEQVYNGVDMALSLAQPADAIAKTIYKSPTAAIDAYTASTKTAGSVASSEASAAQSADSAQGAGKAAEGAGQAPKVPTMSRNFNDIASSTTSDELVTSLENEGWTKTIEPARSARSGETIKLVDPNTGTTVRIQPSPADGKPYFRVQNKGGNYLGPDGTFPDNATKQELRNMTHFYLQT